MDNLLQNFRHKREDEVFAFMSYSLEIVQQKKIHEWRKCKTSSTLLNAKKYLMTKYFVCHIIMPRPAASRNQTFPLNYFFHEDEDVKYW